MAPLVAVGETQQLVGPVTLVVHGGKTLAVTSAELLRPLQDTPLAVMTRLDGSAQIGVATFGVGRYAGVALLELASPVPESADVVPLSIDHVSAIPDSRGAPAAIVTIMPRVGGGYDRLLIAVHVDVDDGSGMSDALTRLASPLEPAHVGAAIEGAPVFAWYPPNPALGRPSEVLLAALAYPYHANIAKPRDLPVLAELVGLEDLGRALISKAEHDPGPALVQVAGEIDDSATIVTGRPSILDD